MLLLLYLAKCFDLNALETERPLASLEANVLENLDPA